ncbi:MAG TPA: hypothetical protein VGA42_07955 [Gemmatimonadales bacterium]
MHRPDLRSERGIALVLTVFALVVIGALVTGAFFVGRVEQITGYNTVWAGQAGEAADAGLTHANVNLPSNTYLTLPVWTPAAPNELVIANQQVQGMPGLVFTDRIRRLNESLFLVTSTGEKRAPGGQALASQTVAALVRMAKPTISVNAAVTVQDPIKFNGNSFVVDGYNSLPAQWSAGECSALDPLNTDDLVGIRSATTTGAGPQDLNNISGFPVPTVDFDPTINSATFQNFLDYTYNTLASQPNVVELPLATPYNGVAPVVDYSQTPAVCDKTAPLNLGEPFRDPPTAGAVTECMDYFPTVHGTGSELKFAAGNRGQGIMLVDGDLELVGGFEWAGLIIVRGQMKITGTGNKIYGAILTESADLNTAGAVSGNIEVHYSACAIEKAVQGAAAPLPLHRGWAQVF